MGECKKILFSFSLAVILKFSDAQKSLELTSEPSSTGSFCQGHVQFTCTGTEIGTVLDWVLNGFVIAKYSFITGHTYPFPVPPTNGTIFPPGVVINVTEAAVISNPGNSIDITTILDVSDVSVLNQLPLHCVDGIQFRSNVINIEVDFRGPSPSPELQCTLQSVSGGTEMVLQWSDEFNAEHVVERYNVRVSPDPASCTSDQVPPHQNYSCSGIDVMSTNYSVSVTAFNCINQEGEGITYDVQPQLMVPRSPQNIESMLYSEVFTVSWMESAGTSGRCSFSGAVNYTVTLKDIEGRTVEQRNVSSDSCVNEICSIDFLPSSLYCCSDINIVATNEFGSSDIASDRIFSPRLTIANQVLLGIGVAIAVFAIAVFGVSFLIAMSVKDFKPCLFLLAMVCGILVLMVVAFMWVAVGLLVGLQDDTCDEDWQNKRNYLIISSFCISLIALIIALIIMIIVLIKRRKMDICECLTHNDGEAVETTYPSSSGTVGSYIPQMPLPRNDEENEVERGAQQAQDEEQGQRNSQKNEHSASYNGVTAAEEEEEEDEEEPDGDDQGNRFDLGLLYAYTGTESTSIQVTYASMRIWNGGKED